MREIIDIDVEIKSHEQTLKDLHQQVIGGDEIVSQFFSVFACLLWYAQTPQINVLDLYKTQTRDKLDDYRKKTSRQKYAKSESYVSFRQSIYVSTTNPRLLHSCLTPPLGGTAPKRGDAACGGILASRSATILRTLH